MSVVDMLNKKHKVMNCVFEILYDLYGEPVWLNKPKDGQEPEKIIEQWIKELGDYSETQLKQACYNLFKYKKVATFPKLAHILAELSDQDKEEIKSKTPETPKAFMCLEVELMKQDIKRNKCKYTLIWRAVQHHVADTDQASVRGTARLPYRNRRQAGMEGLQSHRSCPEYATVRNVECQLRSR